MHPEPPCQQMVQKKDAARFVGRKPDRIRTVIRSSEAQRERRGNHGHDGASAVKAAPRSAPRCGRGALTALRPREFGSACAPRIVVRHQQLRNKMQRMATNCSETLQDALLRDASSPVHLCRKHRFPSANPCKVLVSIRSGPRQVYSDGDQAA